MQKRYELFEQEHQGSYEERRMEEDRQLEEEAELTDETDTDDEEDSEDGDELEDEEERAVKWNVRFQKVIILKNAKQLQIFSQNVWCSGMLSSRFIVTILSWFLLHAVSIGQSLC